MGSERTSHCNRFEKLGNARLEIYLELDGRTLPLGRFEELMVSLEKNNVAFKDEEIWHEAGICCEPDGPGTKFKDLPKRRK